jgi:hypothetical protein
LIDPSLYTFVDVLTPKRPSIVVNSQPSLLQGMLRHSPRASMAAALGLSSPTTVQGYPAHYYGSAAAALAPSMSSVNALSQEFDSSIYRDDMSGRSRTDAASSIRTENRPPFPRLSSNRENPSASDLLRFLTRQEKEKDGSGINSSSSGVGPVTGSNW